MDCLAIMDSGNYAHHLSSILERKGHVFEVVATPCQIARDGCGYCIRLPEEDVGLLVKEAAASRMPVKEVYKVIPLLTRNRYEKIL